MKRLLFFRHCKSKARADTGGDHERPLNERGREAARTMGRFLRDIGQVAESAVTSSALRAQTTLELAREAGEWETKVRITSALYNPGPAQVLEEIRQEPDEVESLLLVGHEPTWPGMIALLSGGVGVRFPTGAMARINVAVPRWRDVDAGCGQLVWLVPPKLLKE